VGDIMSALKRLFSRWASPTLSLGFAILFGLSWNVVRSNQDVKGADITAESSANFDPSLAGSDPGTGQDKLTLRGEPRPVVSVAVVFSPDGKRLASASQDGRVKIWDAGPPDARGAKPGPTPR
jgi:WD40 repeat protein